MKIEDIPKPIREWIVGLCMIENGDLHNDIDDLLELLGIDTNTCDHDGDDDYFDGELVAKALRIKI